jgi:hypothetical protein
LLFTFVFGGNVVTADDKELTVWMLVRSSCAV